MRTLAVVPPLLVAIACGRERPAPAERSETASAAAAAAAPTAPPPCVLHDTAPRPPAPGDTVVLPSYQDVRGERRVECVVRVGEPPLVVATVGDSTNHITRLRVYRPGEAAPLQEFPVELTEPPVRGSAWLVVHDLTHDGWADIQLLDWWGATGNVGYKVWRHDPATRRFVFDSVLSSLPGLDPIEGGRCLVSRMKGGMAGGIYGEATHCWEGGRLVLVRTENQDHDPALDAFVKVVAERRGDSLVVVRVDTVRPER